jgi:hypothetical protein
MTAARAATVFISDDNTTNADRIRWISSDSKPDSLHGTGNDFQETSGVPVNRFRPAKESMRSSSARQDSQFLRRPLTRVPK